MAQQLDSDSLIHVLKFSRQDTNRIKTLNHLGQNFCRAKRYTEAVKFAREADSLSIQINYLSGRSDANNVIGCTCFNQKQYDEARKYYERGLDLATAALYKSGIARSNFNMGLLEWQFGNESKALEHYNKSLTIYTELNDKEKIGRNLGSIANIYLKRKNYEGALSQYNKAIAIFEELGDIENAFIIYFNLGLFYDRQQQFSNSLTNYSKALDLMLRVKDFSRIGILHYSLGNTHFMLGHMKESIHHFKEVLRHEKQLDNVKIIETYRRIGEIYVDQENFEEGFVHLSRALKICHEVNDRAHSAKVYNSIGMLFENKGEYQEAVEAYVTGLGIAEEIGDVSDITTISYNLGFVHELNEQYEEANLRYMKCLEMAQKQGNIKGVAVYTSTLGNMAYSLGNNEKSLQYFLNSIQLCEEQGYKRELLYNYRNIGQVYMDIGNYDEALNFLNKAMQLGEELEDKNTIAKCHSVLGELYINTGDFTLAEYHLKKSLPLTAALGDKFDVGVVYSVLGKLDSLRQDYKSAYSYGQMELLYKDSARSEMNLKQIAEIKEKYESEKKDKEIIRLESDKQINMLLLQASGDSLIIAAAEKRRLQLEKDKIHSLHQISQKEIALMSTEGKLQTLEIDKKNVDYLAQKAENDKNKSDMALMAQQSHIKDLELKKSKLIKNVLLGGLGLLCLLGWFAYSNYTTRQQLKLQTLRNKIASDLHDDVGSTLSSISIFSDMVKLQSKEINPLLDTIGESSKKMLDAMGDIVWTINPENDDFEKILTRMRSFAYELLGAKKIDFAFDADERLHELKLSMDVRKNLFLIFKEATNNLVKYSEADLAQFTITQHNNQITMTIRDNGIGFDENLNRPGNGLNNMKKRAEEMRGKLLIESKRSEGTMIRLSVNV